MVGFSCRLIWLTVELGRKGSLSMMVHHRVMHLSKNWKLALMQRKGMAGLSCEKRKEGREEEQNKERERDTESKEGVGRAEAGVLLLQVPKKTAAMAVCAFVRSLRVLVIRTWWSQFLDPGFHLLPLRTSHQELSRNLWSIVKLETSLAGGSSSWTQVFKTVTMYSVAHNRGKLTFYSCSCKLKLAQVINVTSLIFRTSENFTGPGQCMEVTSN